MKLITNSEELKNRINNLIENDEFVTIDTEFMREKTYYPLLCLVQIAGENDIFAVDPLSEDIDLSSLKELLNNREIKKVFHALGQDMEVLYNVFGEIPNNIFDTQIAAQVLGYGEAIGYANIVYKICNIEIDKTSRHTDWSRRPLSDKQLEYALSDVSYLRDIYLNLIDALHKKERYSWVQEELENSLNKNSYIIEPKDMWKKLKLRGGSPKFLSIVREIAEWRELKAQQVNKPRQWVLKNDAILEIAGELPNSQEEFNKLRFVSGPNFKYADEIIQAIDIAAEKEPPILNKRKSIKNNGAIADLLKLLLKIQCDKNDVATSIVAKSSEIDELSINDKADIPAMNGWRYDIFGKYAIMLKNGEISLQANAGNVVVREANG